MPSNRLSGLGRLAFLAGDAFQHWRRAWNAMKQARAAGSAASGAAHQARVNARIVAMGRARRTRRRMYRFGQLASMPARLAAWGVGTEPGRLTTAATVGAILGWRARRKVQDVAASVVLPNRAKQQ